MNEADKKLREAIAQWSLDYIQNNGGLMDYEDCDIFASSILALPQLAQHFRYKFALVPQDARVADLQRQLATAVELLKYLIKGLHAVDVVSESPDPTRAVIDFKIAISNAKYEEIEKFLREVKP